MKNVILLGGSGYIGIHLAKMWLQKDSKVVVTSISRSGKPKNLPSYLEDNNRIKWIAADVFNVDSYISELPVNAYAIVDLIGTATVETDELFEKINVGPVKIMIELMDKLFISNGCYISGVIGMPGKSKPFLRSKQNAEKLIKESKMQIKIVRPSLVYGDRPEVKAMVPFMKLMGLFKSSYKPVLVDDLSKEIMESFNA